MLESFSTNLTEAVRSGNPVYPVVRDDRYLDIARALLCQERKRVALIGSPWRCRAALGTLASMLANGEVPAIPQDTELIAVTPPKRKVMSSISSRLVTMPTASAACSA